ncbi:MAG: nrdR [Bacillales bacterium]|jgi:transcriptional repressor NrdR|nr:nrdR [Bacillales bacterium]
MKCPECGHVDSKVLESRSIEENTVMKRRRACIECSYRFTTYEKLETTPIVVIKSDGSRQLFSREKILRGLSLATPKRPVTFEQIEKITDTVEQHIKNQGLKEIESKQIGEFVIEQLKELDDVAYVRFASIYRQFKDINSFMKEVETLLKK